MRVWIRLDSVLHGAQVSVGGRKPSHPKLNEREVPGCMGPRKFKLVQVDFRQCLMSKFSRSREFALKSEAICHREHHARASSRILNGGQNA